MTHHDDRARPSGPTGTRGRERRAAPERAPRPVAAPRSAQVGADRARRRSASSASGTCHLCRAAPAERRSCCRRRTRCSAWAVQPQRRSPMLDALGQHRRRVIGLAIAVVLGIG